MFETDKDGTCGEEDNDLLGLRIQNIISKHFGQYMIWGNPAYTDITKTHLQSSNARSP